MPLTAVSVFGLDEVGAGSSGRERSPGETVFLVHNTTVRTAPGIGAPSVDAGERERQHAHLPGFASGDVVAHAWA